MNNNLTELVFIIDKSGSMCSLTEDTIGGFNSMLARQKEETEGKVLVTTVLFNERLETLHDRLDIGSVEPLTKRDYCTCGCTALIDAIGSTIKHIAQIHKYARPEDVPAKTLFIITTDGLENASHLFTPDKVREMVKHEQEKYSWEFVFLGANIDSVETAASFGIDERHAVNYHNDVIGSALKFRAMSDVVTRTRRADASERAVRLAAQRACPTACPDMDDWRAELDADFSSRKD